MDKPIEHYWQIKKIEPVYPELAKRARVQGVVILQVTVDEEGSVSEIRVLRGHPLLDDEAVRAVKQWKYSPTLLNGEPVPGHRDRDCDIQPAIVVVPKL